MLGVSVGKMIYMERLMSRNVDSVCFFSDHLLMLIGDAENCSEKKSG